MADKNQSFFIPLLGDLQHIRGADEELVVRRHALKVLLSLGLLPPLGIAAGLLVLQQAVDVFGQAISHLFVL